jgi:EpsI family protein
MTGKTAVRVYIVVALIPLTWWGARLMNAALIAPEADMPDWSFAEMPRQFGNWQGEDREPDPRIDVATGAKLDTIVNRIYRDSAGHVINMHAAMFADPKGGVYHSPLNCLRSQGWEKLSETRTDLQIAEGLTLPVDVTYWDRNGEKLMVAYWYQLGEHVLFGRWDLGIKVRWSLAGKPTWPALIKVMFTIPVPSQPEEAKTTVLNFAEQVAKWENQPSHRNGKGMLGTPNPTGETKSAAPP